MRPTITVPQLSNIYKILRAAEEAIFDGTGHRLTLSIRETETTIGITSIITTVSETLNVPVYAIISEIRETDVKEARQICAWLIKRCLPTVPNKTIAAALERERTTINHTLAYVADRITTNDTPKFLEKLNAAEEAVKKMLNENKANTP